jgi:GTP cyclohydrolase II
MTPLDQRDHSALSPLARFSLDRAVGDLRRGMPVLLVDGARSVWTLAAETATDGMIDHLRGQGAGAPLLALPAERAAALGLDWRSAEPMLYDILATADLASVRALVDPLVVRESDAIGRCLAPSPKADKEGWAQAAIATVKRTDLLPAAILLPVSEGIDPTRLAADQNCLWINVESIRKATAPGPIAVTRVSEARTPLMGAENTRIIAFRPEDGGPDHLALVIGNPDLKQPVLTRLHSACVTGDFLGSLRCDCGDQLRGAVTSIAEAGGGVLLYLAEEGRGIGIANKLRAYRLQDIGFDTLDANRQIGFRDDERRFGAAVAILRQLGVERVRLLTNNPEKLAVLEAHGVAVVERVPHSFPANPHNAAYLHTKAVRAGHRFS